jgi:ABC-type cobalamin/Fe3+-siderophores transport system ATPase subunit
MLQVENLFVAYGNQSILKNVSFTLQPGQILVVIGPNGSGKSTLLRTLSGILTPHTGKVLINGKNLHKMGIVDRARLIAVVPQAIQLPPSFTAWETVLLGRTPHMNWLGQTSTRDEEIAREAMERTLTLSLASRRVGEISGGEQQRILLARALTQSAPILMMDEPTAHLDLHYQLSLLEQVRTLARQDQLTVIAVLHDLNLVARFADQVALLVDGEITAIGSPTFVFSPDLLSEAYQVPLQVLPIGHGGMPVVLPKYM